LTTVTAVAAPVPRPSRRLGRDRPGRPLDARTVRPRVRGLRPSPHAERDPGQRVSRPATQEPAPTRPRTATPYPQPGRRDPSATGRARCVGGAAAGLESIAESRRGRPEIRNPARRGVAARDAEPADQQRGTRSAGETERIVRHSGSPQLGHPANSTRPAAACAATAITPPTCRPPPVLVGRATDRRPVEAVRQRCVVTSNVHVVAGSAHCTRSGSSTGRRRDAPGRLRPTPARGTT
jgi:hypothetical protein